MHRQSMTALAIAVALGFPAHAQAFATRFAETHISETVVAIDDPNAALGAIELGNIVSRPLRVRSGSRGPGPCARQRRFSLRAEITDWRSELRASLAPVRDGRQTI